MSYHLFIYVLVIVDVFIIGGRSLKLQYKFTTEYISDIFSILKTENIEGPLLPSDPEEQKELCTAARKFASLDVFYEIGSKDFASNPHALSYTKYPDVQAQKVFYHIMWCRTIPQIWLRVIELPNKIMMMMKYSRFADMKRFKFHPIKLTPYPLPCSNAFVECIKAKKSSLLHDAFKPTELLHICMNAKKYVKSARLLNYDVDSTVLKFTYPDNEIQNHLVIKCPSSPVFHVYFEDLASSINVLFQEDADKAEESQSQSQEDLNESEKPQTLSHV